MWHAVPPTMREPVAFREGIQGELSEAEWNDLMTPGTEIHERWKAQVDVIAWFLKQLQYAGVPVLWRPYHEMNGDWFWWGKKAGEPGYKMLWRNMFDRLVYFHGLDNLIWVFNANEWRKNVDPYQTYFPGHDVVDILATDVYSANYEQEDYEALVALANGKPVALGEVGKTPSLDILENQPRWVWFMAWGEPLGFDRDRDMLREIYRSERALVHPELPWVDMERPKVHYPPLIDSNKKK